VYSLRGTADQKLFRGWKASDADVERARDMIAKWDAQLTRDSVAAAIYITWRRTIDGPGPTGDGPERPAPKRPEIEAALRKTIDKLSADLGSDWLSWHYGRVHTQAFPHPILTAFDLPTIQRRGGNGAVGADGASYREIIDVSNWDNSVTVNTPGQSGQPESPYYGNLLPIWAEDQYFPMAFSRPLVDQKTAHRLTLQP
jgi:penicillin amidase